MGFREWPGSWRAGIVLAAAALACVQLLWTVPGYLATAGLPLDDAWIHAVYGRSLARGDGFSYNPGVPASGETAPLWGVVVAIAHLGSSSTAGMVRALKALGFVAHAASALLAWRALGGGPAAVCGAALVALHPDLVAAAVSGMEVPLATAFAFALLDAAGAGSRPRIAGVGLLAPLARPELLALAAVAPWLAQPRQPRRAAGVCAAALCGGLVGFALLGLRNFQATGLALPATFHAKVQLGAGPPLLASLQAGFVHLLSAIALVSPWPALALACAVALTWLVRQAEPPRSAVALLLGVGYCALSFVLVPAVDAAAFYHQRYALPGVALIVAGLPGVVAWPVSRVLPNRPAWLAPGALAALGLGAALACALRAPERHRRLASDAAAIDAVQVRLGRSLASVEPASRLWAVDAGASRYFGAATVVDLMGLNTPQLLGAGAQAFLDAHPPRFLELVPGWTGVDRDTAARLTGTLFEASGPYTISPRFPDMARHYLLLCPPGTAAGELAIRRRVMRFRCAP